MQCGKVGLSPCASPGDLGLAPSPVLASSGIQVHPDKTPEPPQLSPPVLGGEARRRPVYTGFEMYVGPGHTTELIFSSVPLFNVWLPPTKLHGYRTILEG